MNLYDQSGHRKYLNPGERDAFLKAADDAEREVRTFCHTLAYTGCRISEALALTADRVDLKDGTVSFETLKKRGSGVYRPVPIPPALADALNMVHNIRTAQKRRDRGRSVQLWTFARNTAWRHTRAVMEVAKIKGPHGTPKDCAIGTASRPSLLAFRSICCNNYWAIRSFRPRLSMPMLWDRRSGSLLKKCGREPWRP